jgi:predicted alpha/beta hydrolase
MPYTEIRVQPSPDALIVARLFVPASAARAAVLIPSAMGVGQKFYERFADWLCSQGYLVGTFDYRGIGLSAPRQLRGFDATIFDWAREDCAAMIELMKQRLPDAPLYWIGHSLGGQLLGLIPNRDRIDRVITVAAGSGYWRDNAPPTRRVVWWLWFVMVPIALALAGYFPGKRLRKVGDLPYGVMAQWRRWCLNPEYVVGEEGAHVRAAYAAMRTPMLALSFTDDEMMSQESTRSLHSFYVNAPVEHQRIEPTQVGVPRIGHFGFFRAQFENSLWPLAPQWLERRKDSGRMASGG